MSKPRANLAARMMLRILVPADAGTAASAVQKLRKNRQKQSGDQALADDRFAGADIRLLKLNRRL